MEDGASFLLEVKVLHVGSCSLCKGGHPPLCPHPLDGPCHLPPAQ
jgi:hypothetical protein